MRANVCWVKYLFIIVHCNNLCILLLTLIKSKSLIISQKKNGWIFFKTFPFFCRIFLHTYLTGAQVETRIRSQSGRKIGSKLIRTFSMLLRDRPESDRNLNFCPMPEIARSHRVRVTFHLREPMSIRDLYYKIFQKPALFRTGFAWLN